MKKMSYKTMWRSLALGALILSCACSDDPKPEPAPTKAALGEACEVTKDCEEELICRSKVCATRPTVAEMGPDVDMGGGEDMSKVDMNMGGGIDDEDYFISYVMRDRSDSNQKYPFVIDTRTGATTQVTDDVKVCELGCWISKDLSTFIYKRAGTDGKENILTQPIGSDLKLSGSAKELLTNVEDFYFRDMTLTYARGNGGDMKTVYYLPATAASSSEEVKIQDIDATSVSDLWYLDNEAKKALVYSPSNTSLSVRVGELGQPVTADNEIYLFDGANFQKVGGSFYKVSSIPTAFSKDGRYLAMAVNAPNHYDLCQGVPGVCDATMGQKCGLGHSKVGGIQACTVQEITVHLVDLMNLEELPNQQRAGKTCTNDSDCSTAHECYIPDLKAADKSVCIPRRVVLGLPNTPKQPESDPKTGCEMTPVDGQVRYTKFGQRIDFGPDGFLYTTATRQCAGGAGESNIDVTDVLKIPVAERGTPEVVTGNVKENFNALKCYDLPTKMVSITDECAVYIEDAVLSPGGNELVMRATNPLTDDFSTASKKLDIWTIKRDGTKRQWLGNNDKADEVTQIFVHKK